MALPALLACGLAACGAEASRLVQRPPEAMEFILVRRPPPVVPVDIQPARPRPDAVWVPGSWAWSATGWKWNPGAWVVPPEGARWAPWAWSFRADGQVRFWEARWYASDGRPIAPPLPQSSQGASKR